MEDMDAREIITETPEFLQEAVGWLEDCGYYVGDYMDDELAQEVVDAVSANYDGGLSGFLNDAFAIKA